MARIKDVAAKAGVSVATVSRVLNGNPRVKPLLRGRVLQAIAELDYQPSGIARSMRRQSARVIALIISDIQNPFFTSLVRAVEDVAYEHQYTVLQCNSDEDPHKEQLYTQVIAAERVAGVIAVPVGGDSFAPLRKRGVPVVLADRRVPGLDLDSVTIDNVAGAYAATRHLIELGHRRIGLVGAPHRASVALERRQGYEKALLERGIPLDESLIRVADFKEAAGYRAARELLCLEPRPTALFVINNLMTMGALQALQELCVCIPDQVSVVGFDDMPWLRLLAPPLTAVRQPTYQIGVEAARLLFQRLQEGPQVPRRAIVLQPELAVRGSTAAPRA